MDVWWIGGTQASTYTDDAVRVRTTLADAAKRPLIHGLLREDRLQA